MIQVSSCEAKDSASRVKLRRRFVGLLSSRLVRSTVAILALFGCVTLTDGAYAQVGSSAQAAASPEACLAKCTADREQCIAGQSSEELCAYDLKACKKDCEKH
jgi:hypothetical protein